ncbi:MAG: aminoglycoside adenylyltransferase family protein [Actinomycetota bacterium]|nr:aminoglycoside adenylyltransferase family protein [Actinomycetota bacterium]
MEEFAADLCVSRNADLGCSNADRRQVEQVADRDTHKIVDIPGEERVQLDGVMRALHDVLGEALVGAYLFGSAVSGGLKPRSDLDLMVVAQRCTRKDEREALIHQLLDLSGKPRHLEVTILVEEEIKPWRYPPRMDFQYGDWWRDEFETGDLEPWQEVNPDLASLIKMVLVADASLEGPPPGEVFDPVPQQDLVAATVDAIDPLLQDIDDDAHNVVLTLARMWSSISTGEIHSKDAAADWALPRLPAQHRRVLIEARAIYVGEAKEEFKDFVPRARPYAEHVVAEIQELSRRKAC